MLNNKDYIYFFEASEPGFIYYEGNDPCTSLCVVQAGGINNYYKIILNYFRNVGDKEITFKITSVKISDITVDSIVFLKYYYYDQIALYQKKYILITESTVDYLFYFRLLSHSTKMLYAKYIKDMDINDIIKLNQKYFKEINNPIYEMKPGDIHIFAFESETTGILMHNLAQPKLFIKVAYINNYRPLITYFSKDIEEYLVDFTFNDYFDLMFKLSESTINSEINIKSLKTGKNVTINSNNKYYYPNDTNKIFNDKLLVKVTKGNNVIVDILFSAKNLDFEVLNERELIEHILIKPAIIISLDKNNKNTTILLYSKTETPFGFSYLLEYSKIYYISYPNILPAVFTGKYSYNIVIDGKNKNANKDESLLLTIYISQNILNNNIIFISKEDNKETDEEEEEKESDKKSEEENTDKKEEGKDNTKEDNYGLEIWAIAIIGILLLLIVIVIYILCKFFKSKKRKVDNSDDIGPLIGPNINIKE